MLIGMRMYRARNQKVVRKVRIYRELIARNKLKSQRRKRRKSNGIKMITKMK